VFSTVLAKQSAISQFRTSILRSEICDTACEDLMALTRHRRTRAARATPGFIPPQLAVLVKQAPDGSAWLHEIKLDGYRMHARLDDGDVCLLTRTGLDWTHKYPAIVEAIAELPVKTAYLDGELCGVLADGRTAFNLIQNAADTRNGSLIFFLFDLLFLDGEDLRGLPLVERKARLAMLLTDAPPCLQFADHQLGRGPAFHRLACEHGLEGIVSKRVDAPYAPGQRTWRKVKCLNREEFIVVGWSDPEGTRHRLGSLLLGYYTPDGKLIYAGRAGTGMDHRELERLWRRLQPLAVDKMPLAEPPPRGSRFGTPLVLSRVHWVRPEMVVEVSYLTWTEDGLLRHVVYIGEREDKPATEVRRASP
jgi:DNA ligase D-like protein (predicted ligase)